MGAITWVDDDGATRTLLLTFTVLVGTEDDEWYPVELCLDDIPWVLDIYLRREQMNCSCMQGGYFMELDGYSLVDGSAVDEFHHITGWFRALTRLCQGSTRERVAAWEESRMTLTREGALLDIEDFAVPRMRMPFAAFVGEALREAGHFAEFVRRLRGEVARRRAAGPTRALNAVAANLPANLDASLGDLRSAFAHDGNPTPG